MALILLFSLLFVLIINLVAYAIAFIKQTDHLTDITYSLSFLLLAIGLWWCFGDGSIFSLLLLFMILLWGIRLGAFLFYRIHKMKKDTRFDSFRSSPKGFLKFWLLQAISIWIISIPFIIGFQYKVEVMNAISWIGFLLWLLGWAIESLADYQKFRFRQKESNIGEFIQSGLFKYVRHPNYTGEILCWFGVFVFLAPVFSKLEWFSLIGPVWIVVLLLFISGIPLVERSHQKKYGHLASFQFYLNRSWKLIPQIY